MPSAFSSLSRRGAPPAWAWASRSAAPSWRPMADASGQIPGRGACSTCCCRLREATMAEPELAVYIVDDDAAVRDSLSLLLSLRGYRTATFASAEAFLAAWEPTWARCLFADIRMPGMN